MKFIRRRAAAWGAIAAVLSTAGAVKVRLAEISAAGASLGPFESSPNASAPYPAWPGTNTNSPIAIADLSMQAATHGVIGAKYAMLDGYPIFVGVTRNTDKGVVPAVLVPYDSAELSQYVRLMLDVDGAITPSSRWVNVDDNVQINNAQFILLEGNTSAASFGVDKTTTAIVNFSNGKSVRSFPVAGTPYGLGVNASTRLTPGAADGYTKAALKKSAEARDVFAVNVTMVKGKLVATGILDIGTYVGVVFVPDEPAYVPEAVVLDQKGGATSGKGGMQQLDQLGFTLGAVRYVAIISKGLGVAESADLIASALLPGGTVKSEFAPAAHTVGWN